MKIRKLPILFFSFAVSTSMQAAEINAASDDIRTMQGILADTVDLPPDVGVDVKAIDANDDLVVVGARYEDAGGHVDSGAVYIFRVKEEPGVGLYLEQEARLVPPDPEAYANFGFSVATDDGDKVVVGAPGKNVNGKSAAGKAYQFYAAEPGNWVLTDEFEPEDTAENSAESDRFGYSVAVAGDVVAVGAPYDRRDRSWDDDLPGAGRVYVYYRLATPKYGLVAETFGQQSYAHNGWSVDATNHFGTNNPTDEHDFLVVSGAPHADYSGANSGIIYLTFFDEQRGWTSSFYLPSFSKAYDYFGHSVAVRSKMIAAGSPGRDDYAANAGMISVLDAEDNRSGYFGTVTTRLHEFVYATDRYSNVIALEHEHFGRSLDLDGDSSEANVLNYNQLAVGNNAYHNRMHGRDRNGSSNASWRTITPGSAAEDFGISAASGYLRTGLFTVTPFQVGIDPEYDNGTKARVFLYQ